MKFYYTLLFFLFTINFSQSQQKAVTETGDEVVLFDEGTWEYMNEDHLKKTIIPTNYRPFKKDNKSSFLLKSKNLNIGIWLDPKTWSFKKGTDNSDAEYEFQLKDGDLYGLVISEKIEIPLETLKSVALTNAKSVAPDIKIINEEYRTVNGLKVLMIQMNGTTQGIKISYYGYYFPNSSGSVQLLTYTSRNLMDSLKNESDKLLNGLVESN